jgi:hypothetical protein
MADAWSKSAADEGLAVWNVDGLILLITNAALPRAFKIAAVT